MSGALEKIVADIDTLSFSKPVQLSGFVSRFDGHVIECDGFPAIIGTICQVVTQNGKTTNAEIIFSKAPLMTQARSKHLMKHQGLLPMHRKGHQL